LKNESSHATAGHTALVARWPVSSMGGETLDEAHFDSHGLVGDRLFGAWLSDGAKEPVKAGAGPYPALLDWSARYPSPGQQARRREDLPDVEVTAPDGSVRVWSDPELAAALSTALGRQADLRRRDQGFAYFADSVHITFQSSLEALSEAIEHRNLSVLRFRPNLHLDCDAPAFAEEDWSGRCLSFAGGVVLRLRHGCKRCVLPTRNSSNAKDRDKRMLPWLVRNHGMNFGSIADVIVPGRIRAGEGFTVRPTAGTE
jgi:uncharacterized protein